MNTWGRLPCAPPAHTRVLRWRPDELPADQNLLTFGLGRSYGDVALNPGGYMLFAQGLDRVISYDRQRGILRAEAGISLDSILNLIVADGWFLPVTPGTRFVTLGGAIANDVHGKNHQNAGSFGDHITELQVLRSNGLYTCSPSIHPGLFRATIAGLGMTGLITYAEIALRRIPGSTIAQESTPFHGLDEYFYLEAETGDNWEYSVAWIDCLSPITRGIHFRGRHAQGNATHTPSERTFPVDLPFSLVNRSTLSAFNALYWHRPRQHRENVHFLSFFYPLDALLNWNRIYGRKGFYQYQFILPPSTARDGLTDILAVIAKSTQGSFLAVLKTMGNRPPPGMLSFSRPGTTLALDFPNRGAATLALFETLDRMVLSAGGAIYPAKDARMPASVFHAGFPGISDFRHWHDPAFSSSFWRRVAE